MNKPRLLMLFASLSIGLLFLFPMWKIDLKAPQYPEGLEMHIWVNKIGGNSEFTLQNFNILNHYIGMEVINPDSFKELKIMPWVVVFFMITGLLLAIFPLRAYILTWVVSLMIAGAIGLFDFYLWLVKFGTNLDPTAPIKIPGMTYIPPFIGPKQLLNFDAFSFPAAGSAGVMMSVVFALVAVYLLYFKKTISKYGQ
jgi:copper chaperone NosL